MQSHSFQPSPLSKKIRKNSLSNSSKQPRKNSDLPISRSFNPMSEFNSSALINLEEFEWRKHQKNKALTSGFALKGLKDLERMLKSKRVFTKSEALKKIEQIVSNLERPKAFDYGADLQQIKQLIQTQEETIKSILDQKQKAYFLTDIYSKLKEKTNFIEETQHNLTTNEETKINDRKNLDLDSFSNGFIENFDFKLNFSTPYKKEVFSFENKENIIKDYISPSQKTQDTLTPLTPCSIPLLEPKRLLSSQKIEDMTDFSPEKRNLIIDFNREDEQLQWFYEEREEWEYQDF